MEGVLKCFSQASATLLELTKLSNVHKLHFDSHFSTPRAFLTVKQRKRTLSAYKGAKTRRG
jgi:hypothetical protein